MGLSDVDFVDNQNRRIHETVFQLPFGLGVKYRWNSRIAFRAELLDNVSFAGGDVDVMHNVSVTAGLEYRFGGRSKKTYWPWNPSRTWK
jgi:hypothetical protein